MGKTYVRGARLYNFMRSTKAGIRNAFMNCRRFCWTHEDMLKYRNEHVFTGHWPKLTSRDQAELMGYWEALHDDLYDQLEGRYLIEGRWLTVSEVSAEKAFDRCDHKNYHKVFTVNLPNGPEYRIYA